jgi:hypothetical protein
VPLKLYNEDNLENVLQNLRSPSTWHCRPIKFGFVKVIEALIQLEVAAIKAAISNLNKFESTVADSTVFVRFDMNFTMIDGKVCNAVSENMASQRCYKFIPGQQKLNTSHLDCLLFIPIFELLSVCCILRTIGSLKQMLFKPRPTKMSGQKPKQQSKMIFVQKLGRFY